MTPRTIHADIKDTGQPEALCNASTYGDAFTWLPVWALAEYSTGCINCPHCLSIIAKARQGITVEVARREAALAGRAGEHP